MLFLWTKYSNSTNFNYYLSKILTFLENWQELERKILKTQAKTQNSSKKLMVREDFPMPEGPSDVIKKAWTRKLRGGTEENSVSPKRGHWFAHQANQWFFTKRKQKKIELVAIPGPGVPSPDAPTSFNRPGTSGRHTTTVKIQTK